MNQTRQLYLWGLDAFADDMDLQNQTAEAVKSFLAIRPGAQILPVYVLSPDYLNWSGEFTGPWTTRYKPMALEAMSAQLETWSIPNCMRPHVLVQTFPSRRKSIHKLLALADRVCASGLILNTHARRGAERLLVGSFTESLLQETHLPVFVLNPHAPKVKGAPQTLIFATDFSDASHETFKMALEFARQGQMKVHIYSQIANPIDPVIQSGVYLFGGGWVSVESYFAREHEERTAEANLWIEQAKSVGVEAISVIEEAGLRTSDAIVQYAEQQPHPLIMMTKQSGRAASLLLGSTTREVVRIARSPVWVLPSPRAEEATESRHQLGHQRATPAPQLGPH